MFIVDSAIFSIIFYTAAIIVFPAIGKSDEQLENFVPTILASSFVFAFLTVFYLYSLEAKIIISKKNIENIPFKFTPDEVVKFIPKEKLPLAIENVSSSIENFQREEEEIKKIELSLLNINKAILENKIEKITSLVKKRKALETQMETLKDSTPKRSFLRYLHDIRIALINEYSESLNE